MASTVDSSSLTGISSAPGQPAGYPFRGPGLVARVAPFGVVMIFAEASLALPSSGTMSPSAVVASIVLLLAIPAAFLLPWSRLPVWMSVLVPVISCGWVLALVLAEGGAHVGLSPIALIPPLWTALFHRRWESACIVGAIAVVEVADSLAPSSASAEVILRRVILWVLLSGLISVAAHGLRDRIHRSQQQSARLQEQLRQLSVLEDRDRIAADLQDKVIQPIFAAGLTLQGAAAMTVEPEASRRVRASIEDLDRVLRVLRNTIFGLERDLRSRGLRREILDLSGQFSPQPEVTFSGPVDSTLPAGTGAALLEVLRDALGQIRQQFIPVRIGVTAAGSSYVTVVDVVPRRPAFPVNGSALEFSTLRDRATRAGIRMGVELSPAGTRLAWHVPLASS
jgi:signal transduction histidine kinase